MFTTKLMFLFLISSFMQFYCKTSGKDIHCMTSHIFLVPSFNSYTRISFLGILCTFQRSAQAWSQGTSAQEEVQHSQSVKMVYKIVHPMLSSSSIWKIYGHNEIYHSFFPPLDFNTRGDIILYIYILGIKQQNKFLCSKLKLITGFYILRPFVS